MKEKYRTVSIMVVEAAPDKAILAGSIIPTTSEIVFTMEEVTVSEFKEDEDFKENGFGDISF